MENIFISACDFDQAVYYTALFPDFNLSDPNHTLTLYHYTNQETYERYIYHPEKNQLELRLTNITMFLDDKEGYHIFPLLYKLFAECKNDGTIDSAFHRKLAQELMICENQFRQLGRWYVLSFSRESNCQYLKENYACKNGRSGIILGLQTNCLVDTASQNPGFSPACAEKRTFKDDFPTAFLRDVLYDECLIKDFIHNAIGSIYTFRNQIGTSHFSLQHFVQTLVDAYRLYFKDSHFDKEKETRLIVDGNTVQNYPDVYSFSSYYTPHPAQDEQKSYLYLYLNDCSLYHVEHVASQICSCD